ncbi:MAG: GCN5-related N-acetyltransferase [Anaerolineae bacterium]|jgi:mycothiol synthase|nr:MAG: GCN5-related N-acetyltransferase [Anaerolineae bacterium]
MNTTINYNQKSPLTTSQPVLEGFNSRPFQGESDYPKMVAILQACSLEDCSEMAVNEESIRHQYQYLIHCDPHQDMIFVETADKTVAYGRVEWRDEIEGNRIYALIGHVHPQWRRKGIGRWLLAWLEKRAYQLAGENPSQRPHYLEVGAVETQIGARVLFEQQGYQAVRYFCLMVRPNLEAIPTYALPAGIEIRPVLPEHYEKIYAANLEAFRDHWGSCPDDEPPLQAWLDDPNFDPSLWCVAWEGNEVVGMVLNFIDAHENRIYQRKRGYTENIAVRRPWRRRGIARALIANSLRMLKERGMEEAALGVDTQNPSGALHLYESLGYRVVRQFTTYRKEMTGLATSVIQGKAEAND